MPRVGQEQIMYFNVHLIQAEAELTGTMVLEKDALKQQAADLRDKLSKALSDLEYAKIEMENMVPRSVCMFTLYLRSLP